MVTTKGLGGMANNRAWDLCVGGGASRRLSANRNLGVLKRGIKGVLLGY